MIAYSHLGISSDYFEKVVQQSFSILCTHFFKKGPIVLLQRWFILHDNKVVFWRWAQINRFNFQLFKAFPQQLRVELIFTVTNTMEHHLLILHNALDAASIRVDLCETVLNFFAELPYVVLRFLMC